MGCGSGRWRISCLVFLALAWVSDPVCAEEILDYHVDLAGSSDGTLAVEERIDYDFGGLQRHGIYRDIPITVPAHWGGRRTLKITEIAVALDRRTAPWVKESVRGDAGPMLRLRIGDPDRTVTGRHSYTLRYQVVDALLPAGDRDAFRWNAIGTGWNIPIESASIRMSLPEPLRGHPDVGARFFTGAWGSTAQNGRLDWNRREGMITVTAGPLAPHEGVTVEASFPVGAISATAHPSALESLWKALPNLWAWPLMLLGVGLAWRHWNRVGRDPATGPVVVRYEPPKHLEAAEAGLLIDQSLDNPDLTGTVIELARDGWIKVEHPQDDGMILKLLKGTRVTLERLRPRSEWSQLPPYKRYLMESFFCRGDRFSPGSVESSSDVRERNLWLDKAKARIYERGVEHALFPENPKRVRTKYLVGAALSGLVLLGLAFWQSPWAIEATIPALLLLVMIAIFSFTWVRNLRRRTGGAIRILFAAVFGIGMFVLLLLFTQTQASFSFPAWGPILLSPFTPLILLATGLFLFAWQMPRRTMKGAQVQRELLGFKRFMKRAEAPRLRLLLEADPGYFERTLPFAALFGLLSEWTNRFDGLVQVPVWFDGGSFEHLGQDLNRLSSGGVSSSPPASSGGSSGGGGFSGGGGGGGGGGSW